MKRKIIICTILSLLVSACIFNEILFIVQYSDVYIRLENIKSKNGLRLYIGLNPEATNYIQFTPCEYDNRYPAFFFVKPDTVYVVDINNEYIKEIRTQNIIIKHINLPTYPSIAFGEKGDTSKYNYLAMKRDSINTLLNSKKDFEFYINYDDLQIYDEEDSLQLRVYTVVK